MKLSIKDLHISPHRSSIIAGVVWCGVVWWGVVWWGIQSMTKWPDLNLKL